MPLKLRDASSAGRKRKLEVRHRPPVLPTCRAPPRAAALHAFARPSPTVTQPYPERQRCERPQQWWGDGRSGAGRAAAGRPKQWWGDAAGRTAAGRSAAAGRAAAAGRVLLVWPGERRARGAAGACAAAGGGGCGQLWLRASRVAGDRGCGRGGDRRGRSRRRRAPARCGSRAAWRRAGRWRSSVVNPSSRSRLQVRRMGCDQARRPVRDEPGGARSALRGAPPPNDAVSTQLGGCEEAGGCGRRGREQRPARGADGRASRHQHCAEPRR